MSDERQPLRQPGPRQDDTAELKSLVSKLQARLVALETKPPAQMFDPTPSITARMQASTKTEQKIQQLERTARTAIEQLQTGPNKYRVSLTGEPRLTQIVGATGEGDADLKFRRYHGIRSIVDTEKRILVEPAEEAVAV